MSRGLALGAFVWLAGAGAGAWYFGGSTYWIPLLSAALISIGAMQFGWRGSMAEALGLSLAAVALSVFEYSVLLFVSIEKYEFSRAIGGALLACVLMLPLRNWRSSREGQAHPKTLAAAAAIILPAWFALGCLEMASRAELVGSSAAPATAEGVLGVAIPLFAALSTILMILEGRTRGRSPN